MTAECGKQFSNSYLKKLILPLAAEQALGISVGMFDTIMVSTKGEAAMSGVALIDNINILIFNIFTAFATGGAVISSQFIGDKKEGEARTTASQIIMISLMFSIVIAGLCLLFRSGIINVFFGKPEDDVIEAAMTYFWISALTYPLIAIYSSAAAVFRSMGKSSVTLAASSIGSFISIGLNALFLYAFDWGVAGVGFATLIARAVSMIILLIALTNKKNPIFISFKKKFKFNAEVIKRIFGIAAPNGIENSLFQAGRIIVLRIIITFGTYQVAANSAANNLSALGCIPGQAFMLALITVTGQCVGAGDCEQVRFYTRKLLKQAYLFSALINIAILVGLPWILKLYNIEDDSYSLAVILTIIHNGSAILLWPTAFVLPSTLRASNDVTFTMIVSITTMAVFRLGIGIFLAMYCGLGAIGIFIGMVIDWIFRSMLFIIRYRGKKWETKYQA